MAEEIKNEGATSLGTETTDIPKSTPTETNNEEATPSGIETADTPEGTTDKPRYPAKKVDPFESAMRTYKRQSTESLFEIKKREAYDKPSVKRKKKSKRARKHRNNRFNGGRR